MFWGYAHSLDPEIYYVPADDWELIATATVQIEFTASLSSSPTDSTPHRIYEFQIDMDTTSVPFNDVWNALIRVYDASNTEDQTWPPNGDLNVPDTWGEENYSTEAIPEGLTFAVMALLTTVSMLVGYKYFLKRKETRTQ